jgi:hypothetical protein
VNSEPENEAGPERQVARWRVVAAIAVLVGLAGFAGVFAPIYFHNLELQGYVAELAQDNDSRSRPDDLLRTRVLEKAAELELPVKADNVHIERKADGMRIDVRYFVRVNLPGYTVDLHFYPGAGSR